MTSRPPPSLCCLALTVLDPLLFMGLHEKFASWEYNMAFVLEMREVDAIDDATTPSAGRKGETSEK